MTRISLGRLAGLGLPLAISLAFAGPAAADLTVGVSLALTGPGSALGIPVRNGFDLCVSMLRRIDQGCHVDSDDPSTHGHLEAPTDLLMDHQH